MVDLLHEAGSFRKKRESEQQMNKETVSVPAGKVYFAEDYIDTYDYGLFQNMDALIVYVNDNIKEVTGSRNAEVIRWERDKTTWNYSVVYRTCEGFDYGCECSATTALSMEYGKLPRDIDADEATVILDNAYEHGNQNRNPKDCEAEIELSDLIKRTGIEIGVVIR